MGHPGKKDVKRICGLLVDDLKVYQKNHKTLKDVNEMIVQARNDTDACHGVVKCVKIAFDGKRWWKVKFVSAEWKSEEH